MSNSPVIPKEKLSAYQRWELHSFEAPAGTPAAANKASADAEKVRHLHQHAYDAGRADGLREGAQKSAQEAQQFKALLVAVEQQSHEVNQHIAHDVLELALEIAQQMVRQALAVKPELIIALIQDALARTVQPLTAASIALHPADAALVRAQLGTELAAAGWRIVDDANVQRGGALLQTAATQIDATLGTRWRRLAAALGQDSAWLAG
jgi:flagellar assembly protein FliH